MVTEQGVIEKASHRKAVVRIQRSSACAHCKSRGSCGVAAGEIMTIEVTNDLQAKANDHVEISVPSGSLVKLSLLVYFIPVLALVVGAGAGAAWAKSFNMQPTLASIVCGAVAMGIVFLVLKWLDRHARVKGKYQPHITKILFRADPPQSFDSR